MVMKKISFSTILLIIWCQSQLLAQNHADMNSQVNYPSSPTAASLGRYGEYPVNLQNGLVSIDIPFTAVQGRKINFPISISYHASGIKVDQEASWVGLGWSLNASGVITRKIVGGPDDYGAQGFIQNAATIKEPGEYDLSVDSDWFLVKDAHTGKMDLQPDIYNFNMPGGYAGSFSYASDGKFYAETLDNLKISYDKSIQLFEITTDDGTLYRFGLDLENNPATEETTIIPTRADFNGSPGAISSWYLTEIISPAKEDTVFFTYTSHNYSDLVVSGQSVTIAHDDPHTPGIPTLRNSTSVVQIPDARKLATIRFSRGKLVFNTLDDRQDRPNIRLSSIDVFEKLGGQYEKIQTIELLNNDYYDRFTATKVYFGAYTPSNEKSLKLNGVTIRGIQSGGEKKYQFAYNDIQLPARETTPQDYWGYFNGKTLNQNLVPKTERLFGIRDYVFGDADRSPSAEHMKAGMLERITYPTGGTTVFDYEPHYYLSETEETSQDQEDFEVANVTAIGKIVNPDPTVVIETKLVDEAIIISNRPGSAVLNYEFTQVNELGSELPYPKIELFETDAPSNVLFTKIYHGTSEPLTGQVDVDLIAGRSYTFRATICDCTTQASIIGAALASASLIYPVTVTVTEPALIEPHMVGGLRIKSIKNFTDQTSLTPAWIKSYTYGAQPYGSEGVGTGYLISPNIDTYTSTRYRYRPLVPDDVIEDIINNACYEDWKDLVGTEVAGFTASANSFVDFGYNGGSPVEYDLVTEYNGTPIDNEGKTVYHYERTVEEVGFFGNIWLQYDFLMYPKYQSGILRKKITYERQGDVYNPRVAVTYNYSTIKETKIRAQKVYRRPGHDLGFYDTNGICARDGILEPFNYWYSLGKRVLVSEVTQTYGDNGNVLAQARYLTYEPDYLQVSEERIKGSDLSNYTTKYKYPYNRAEISGLAQANMLALEAMENSGRVGQIVEQKRFKESQLLETSRTDFLSDGPNAIRASQVLTGYGSNPLEEIVTFEAYNGYGNLVQYKDRSGLSTAVIWGCRPVVTTD